MKAATTSKASLSVTLWSVNHGGCEVRCDVETRSSWNSLLRGTARLVIAGAAADTRVFTSVDELIELTADWHQTLAPAVGAWQ